MSARKMHADEVDTDAHLVRQLVAAQFPQWAQLPIEPVPSAGTDNAIYRLGTEMAVRLPRIEWAVRHVDKEQQWLPRLAQHLPLAIPVPLAKGTPAAGYPWPWSIYRWIEGEFATVDRIGSLRQAAIDLAGFVGALQRIDTGGAPRARRVWVHGDLLAGNLLVVGNRLRAVIDFGGVGVGDPACDLMIAWGLFSGESRDAFRAALGVDDATWARGRGHALSQAAQFIPYYLETNPVGVARAKRAVDDILDDHEVGA